MGPTITFIIIGLLILWDYYNKSKKYTIQVTGKVSEIVEEVTIDRNQDGSPDQDYDYYLVVEYEIDGETYAVQSKQKCNPNSYQIGQNIDIICAQDNLNDFRINTFSKKQLYIGIGLIIFGFLIPIIRP